jgi:hypothetical protein
LRNGFAELESRSWSRSRSTTQINPHNSKHGTGGLFFYQQEISEVKTEAKVKIINKTGSFELFLIMALVSG